MITISKDYRQDIDGIDVITPRIAALRQLYYDSEAHICPARSHLATLSWKETEGQPLHLRRAKLFGKVCDEIPVAIFDNELVVGSQTLSFRGVGLQLDFSSKVGFEIEEGDRRLRAEQSIGELTEEDLKTITEDTRYWKGRSPGDIILKEIREKMGTVFEDVSYDLCTRSYGTLSFYSPDADYDKVLRVGLKGVISEIDMELEKLDFTSVNDGKKYHFLRAAKISCEAAIRFARRYAELARDMASKEKDIQRKRELETIAEVCENVPENPARNFWEALQSVRFIHVCLYLEDGNGSGAVLGRMDQYLYPYYKSDIEQGKLTRKQAGELLASFQVKVATVEAIPPGVTKTSGSGYVDTKVVLGGVDRNGVGASNELTYLILHVAGQMVMDMPLYLRWHSGMSRELMLKAAWTNIQIGSEPAFHNDEQIIPGLVADGASLEDARDYLIHGCAHPFPAGSTYGTYHFLNGGKALELVMYKGLDPRTGKQLGIETGDPRRFTSIDDWVDAFMKQWDYMYDIIIKGCNIGELTQMLIYSQPFASAMNPDCIKNGLGVHEGGGRYPQFTSDIFNKLYADVPDSLIAIKEMVYDQKKITIEELLEACSGNFEGENQNHIRNILNSATKYGNDSGEPEKMYRLLNDHAGAFGRSRKGYFGHPKRDVKIAGAVHLAHGKVVGALPNGRKAGMPLANGGISPCAGCDTKGPTVTFRSAANALDFNSSRSAVLNQKIPKSLMKTEDHMNLFVDLMETYFKNYNGYQVQWNIEDKEAYLAAKANPSAYKNLIVRVGGFSAYFIELDPLLQDEIIARADQGLGTAVDIPASCGVVVDVD
ncbi:pyruvate formate lyase family protein [Thermodesulfobacteriota bacterium]